MQTPRKLTRAALATAAALATLAVLLGDARPASAALTSEACLAQRAKLWGKRRQCERNEDAKAILGRPSSYDRCLTKFFTGVAKLETTANQQGIPCRYRDNGDNTVTDFRTGLMWAKLTSPDGVFGSNVLDGDNTYDWKGALAAVATLNGPSANGSDILPVTGNGGYRDWRLPNIRELQTIFDPTVPSCGSLPCADPILGPMLPYFYWSATSATTNGAFYA